MFRSDADKARHNEQEIEKPHAKIGLKQKVSRGFPTEAGIGRFASICSYLSTLRKQGADIFQALVLTSQGSPPLPKPG